jgi:hypothetical protein
VILSNDLTQVFFTDGSEILVEDESVKCFKPGIANVRQVVISDIQGADKDILKRYKYLQSA